LLSWAVAIVLKHRAQLHSLLELLQHL
jgi:hypothetical protein